MRCFSATLLPPLAWRKAEVALEGCGEILTGGKSKARSDVGDRSPGLKEGADSAQAVIKGKGINALAGFPAKAQLLLSGAQSALIR